MTATLANATDALERLAGGRERLRPAYAAATAEIKGRRFEAQWKRSAAELLAGNPGLSAALAFFVLSRRLAGTAHGPSLVPIADLAGKMCRSAGSGSVLALMGAAEAIVAASGENLGAVLTVLECLAEEVPDAIPVVLPALPQVVSVVGATAYGEWVAAGRRAYAADRGRLADYLALKDPLARSQLNDHGRAGALRRAAPTAAAFAAALTGRKPTIRFVPAAVRASLAPPIVVMPAAFSAFAEARQADLAAAVIAHAAAHDMFGSPRRFDPKRLKPVQIALVSLLEDARVEARAMSRFPGLRRLWAPFHAAEPTGARTVPDLLARMARALFDPAYEDPESWIAKARSLVCEAGDRLDDATVLRDIGSRLGNDIGQMRLSFNAKAYVVEPAYRDDNAVLWSSDVPPESEAAEVDVAVEAVRRREEETSGSDRRDDEVEEREAGGARSHRARSDEGAVIARLSEWDYAAGLARPDWVTVRTYPPGTAEAAIIERLGAESGLARQLEALIRGARLGLPQRLKKQAEGDALDLDAAIAATIARRSGEVPDTRIYRRTERRIRDIATVLLVDTSESTRGRLPGRTARILDVETEAAAALAAAVDAAGDRLLIDGFSSNGRSDVRICPVKDFGEAFAPRAVTRLAGLAPGYSTRLGAVIRFGGARLARERAYRRVLIVLTDGEPFDVDVKDPRYLVEDARRAVAELRGTGIDAVGLGIGGGVASGKRVFGRGNFVPVLRPDALPKALAALYFRLSAR